MAHKLFVTGMTNTKLYTGTTEIHSTSVKKWLATDLISNISKLPSRHQVIQTFH